MKPKRKTTATKRAKTVKVKPKSLPAKPKPSEPAPLETGLYSMEQLYELVRAVVKAETPARITLPRTWCQSNPQQIPLLGPKAVKLIDLGAAPDSTFPKIGMFVMEIGRKQFKWPKVS